jgi:phosphoribosylamine-glycine ligase
MVRHKIPTAKYRHFPSPTDTNSFIENQPEGRCVVKASRLAAGKGVVLADTKVEAKAAVDYFMVKRAFGEAGEEIVIE